MSASRQVQYDLAALIAPTDPARQLPEANNERLLAILAEVRGREILHIGCVNHRLPESPAEARHYLHYQLCRRFADSHVVGLDIEAQAIAQLDRMGFDVVTGDAHNLPYRQELQRRQGMLFELAGEPAKAVAIYQKMLQENPNDNFAPLLREKIKLLETKKS